MTHPTWRPVKYFIKKILMLPPNKIQQKIITSLRLCSFIDREEQDLLESMFILLNDEYIMRKLCFNIVFHVLFSILFYKYYFS